MTPKQEEKLLDSVSKQIRKDAEAGKDEVFRLITDEGLAPQDAVERVNKSYRGKYSALFAKSLSEILGESVTAKSALNYKVGDIPLSKKLYANEKRVSQLVKAAVTDHVKGLQDSRKLALELYEGYDFRPDEVLKISRRNKVIPKYMREALLIDPKTGKAFSNAFSKATAKALRTGALRAAYLELLDEIDKIEDGVASELLEKKLQVAYEEKVRYFSNRIAQTELHRQYELKTAVDLSEDEDVEFVQYRLGPKHPVEDICDYFARVDKYGKGAGVFPVEEAPVPPIHPFCRCNLTPRLDLTGTKKGKLDPNAERVFFESLSVREQKLVAGTQANREKLMQGTPMDQIWNAKQPDAYKVKTVNIYHSAVLFIF